MAALVVIAAICLWAAAALIGSAIQTLHSSVAGAGVDTGAGSGGAAARRDSHHIRGDDGRPGGAGRRRDRDRVAATVGFAARRRQRRFVGGALGATAGYIALLFLTGLFASTVAAGQLMR
jgi:hypothetical protein